MRLLAFLACVLALALAAASSAAAMTSTFVFTGRGFGHGIGLSQYGAQGYAQHGWAYEAILGHYYTGRR